MGQLASRRETFSENSISVEQMGGLIDLLHNKKITGTLHSHLVDLSFRLAFIGTSGKSLMRHILATRTTTMPSTLAQELSLLASPADDSNLEAWCAEAIAALPEEADAARRGNANVVNKIVGRVMKASRGTANAQSVKAMSLKLLH